MSICSKNKYMGRAIPSLQSFVGLVPTQFNMIVGDSFPGASPFVGLGDAWSFDDSSISSGVLAPDETTGAYHLTENSANAAHFTTALVGFRFGVQTQQWPYGIWRFAAILKAAERTRCVLRFELFGDVAPHPEVSVGFNLAGGNVGYDNASVNGTNVNSTIVGATMTALGNGWYLCIVDFTFPLITPPSAVNFGQGRILLDNGSGTAARSTTYTGNGTAGINIWWASVLPKGAWSLNNLAFFDDFNSLDTIDITNSGAPGFNWYLRHRWPENSTLLHGALFFNSPPPADDLHAGDLSVASSVVTIARDRSSYSECLTTAASVAGNSYVGQVFGFPGIFEARLKWDSTLFSGGFLSGNTSFWGSGIEMLTGSRPGSGSTTFRELDIVEGTQGPRAGDAIHDWNIADGGIITETGSGTLYDNGAVGGNPFDAYNSNTLHRYAVMIVPASFNGGLYSLKLTFLDGLMVGGEFYGATIRPNNDAGKPIGAHSTHDGDYFPLMLGAGQTNSDGTPSGTLTHVPLSVDWVRVFQAA